MESLLIQHHVLAVDSDAFLLVPPQHAHDCSSASSDFVLGSAWQQQGGSISAHHGQLQQPTLSLPAEQDVGTASTPATATATATAAASDNEHAITGMAPGRHSCPWFQPPKMCYTITTWAPLPVLQHLQQQSRAICASAAAGACVAAATIPGRPAMQPQQSMQEDDSCASIFGTNYQVQHLQAGGECPLRTSSALPAQLLAPLDPDLEAGATAALQYSSASLFVKIRTDDQQQQLRQQILARQHCLLPKQQLHQQKHTLQQQHQEQGKQDASRVPTKRRCFDTSAAAHNNLAVNCEGCYSNSCTADASCYNDAHAAVSPDNGSTMYTPTYSSTISYRSAASPCLNNSDGSDLSPMIRTANGAATTAAAAAVSTATMAHRLQAMNPEAVLEPSRRSTSHAAVHALSTFSNNTADSVLQSKHDGSRDDWLGSDEAEVYWHQQRNRPAAFTFGVHTMLAPTGRETAAAEAFADAAYTAAAAGGVHPDERAEIAKRLAVVAVHTAKAELAARAAVSGQPKPGSRVPAAACGYIGWPTRSFTTVGPTLPAPIPRPAVSQVPASPVSGAAACMVASAAAPDTSAPCMEQQQPAEQNQDFQQDQATTWATSNAFAAPAANTNNNWVVGAVGIAGPNCSYWQQHQQELAGFSGWSPAETDTVHSQPLLQQGMPYEQPPHGCCEQTAHPCNHYSAYYDYYKQIDVPECPLSPQLDGVDYMTDQCTMVCYSNSWKRTVEEALGAGA